MLPPAAGEIGRYVELGISAPPCEWQNDQYMCSPRHQEAARTLYEATRADVEALHALVRGCRELRVAGMQSGANAPEGRCRQTKIPTSVARFGPGVLLSRPIGMEMTARLAGREVSLCSGHESRLRGAAADSRRSARRSPRAACTSATRRSSSQASTRPSSGGGAWRRSRAAGTA